MTYQALLVIAWSLLLAISARVQVPFWPVPMTMQTFVVPLIGASYGARLAGINPLEEKRASHRANIAIPTFGAFAGQYVGAMRPSWRNPKHAAQWAMTLERYAKLTGGAICSTAAASSWRHGHFTASRARRAR